MILSAHQADVIRRMREGKNLWECIIQIRTIAALERMGLIEKVETNDGWPWVKWGLSDEGKELELK